MPKIVVMVEKDETGRLWDYVLQEKELSGIPNAIASRPIWIHRVDDIENVKYETVRSEVVRNESSFVEVCSVPILEDQKFTIIRIGNKDVS